MKQLFAYIRVSTNKQNEGVSPEEQRAVIEEYAKRMNVEIVEWFKETRTAATAGRPEFNRMVKLLRKGKAEGLITHKVDRGTRNYRDWAELTEIVDSGFEVHFANDNIDMRSRGGRLAADVQVLVAVDYIRNLREEALKGIHGRLKQGILPHHAPIGYLDRGRGQPKAIDPVRAPLIRRLFQLYASGAHNLRELAAEGVAIGLRNRNENPLRLTQIHCLLRNCFYAGVIRSARFGLFPGAHEPIVTRATFDRVQAVLAGKFIRRTKHHQHLFRRLLHCKTCGRSLIASARKGFVYYRCSTTSCPTTSVREDRVEAEIRELLQTITLDAAEAEWITRELAASEHEAATVREARRKSIAESIAVARARVSRLTDLLLDGKVDAAAHDERRAQLVLERHKLEQDLADLQAESGEIIGRARRIVELAQFATFLYETANADRKRGILETVMSDCLVDGKTLQFSLHEPFAMIAEQRPQQDGRPHWNTARTFGENRTFMEELLRLAAACPARVAELLKDNVPEEEVQESV